MTLALSTCCSLALVATHSYPTILPSFLTGVISAFTQYSSPFFDLFLMIPDQGLPALNCCQIFSKSRVGTSGCRIILCELPIDSSRENPLIRQKLSLHEVMVPLTSVVVTSATSGVNKSTSSELVTWFSWLMFLFSNVFFRLIGFYYFCYWVTSAILVVALA